MRTSLGPLVIALLIAFFAIGVSLPAFAFCETCQECTAAAPTDEQAPCPHQGLACAIAQTCGSQLPKVPAHEAIDITIDPTSVTYGPPVLAAITSTFIVPEPSPPRL